MKVLVCVKRVPMVGGRIVVTADGQGVDNRQGGYTISPHEECAVEEAVQIVEQHGGSVTVLTLGPPEAEAQLRDMVAIGAGRAVLLETDGGEWGPAATAAAIVAAARRDAEAGEPFDLLLFGNEAADTGDYQVAVRVAVALGLPCVTAIKNIDLAGRGLRATRDYRGVTEHFDVPLPAVVAVKEGINLPRYPSFPGRVRAKKAAIERSAPAPDSRRAGGLRTQRLRVPEAGRRSAEILGTGTDAVPALVKVLEELGVLP